jgi:hypothetical protein
MVDSVKVVDGFCPAIDHSYLRHRIDFKLCSHPCMEYFSIRTALPNLVPIL